MVLHFGALGVQPRQLFQVVPDHQPEGDGDRVDENDEAAIPAVPMAIDTDEKRPPKKGGDQEASREQLTRDHAGDRIVLEFDSPALLAHHFGGVGGEIVQCFFDRLHG